MRSEFEMLPFVALMLDDNFIFVEQSNEYTHKNHTEHRVTLGYLNGAWLTYQNRHTEVDELQKRVDAAHDALTELKEKSEALHHRWQIFSDSVALAEAEMIDMCVKELEQALKGGGV